MAVPVDAIVKRTISEFIEWGVMTVVRADPFARDAMAAYIVAMEEDGDYPDLVQSAKQKFIDLFGEW